MYYIFAFNTSHQRSFEFIHPTKQNKTKQNVGANIIIVQQSLKTKCVQHVQPSASDQISSQIQCDQLIIGEQFLNALKIQMLNNIDKIIPIVACFILLSLLSLFSFVLNVIATWNHPSIHHHCLWHVKPIIAKINTFSFYNYNYESQSYVNETKCCHSIYFVSNVLNTSVLQIMFFIINSSIIINFTILVRYSTINIFSFCSGNNFIFIIHW